LGDDVQRLRILGLGRLDIRELTEFLSPTEYQVDVDQAKGRPGTAYEPGTVALVILLTSAALHALAQWALKNRYKKTIEIQAEEVRPDGSSSRTTIKIELNESTAEAEVIKAIGDQLKIGSLESLE